MTVSFQARVRLSLSAVMCNSSNKAFEFGRFALGTRLTAARPST